MDAKKMLADLRAQISAKLKERNAVAAQLRELRDQSEVDEDQVTQLREQQRALDAEIDQLDERANDTEAEIARDAHLDELAKRHSATGASVPATEGRVQIVSSERTYHRGNDKRGTKFVSDVVRAFAYGDVEARGRLERHMAEERVERGAEFIERATGSGAFAGLVVPQYAVDAAAPSAAAGRPFADACTHHDLPEKGMTVEISRITTATSAAVQSAENATLSETDIDDTLLTVPIRTAGGTQTVSLQAALRGEGVLDTVIADLVGQHNTALDGALFSTATVGLSALATAVAYTDASPTAAEAYPKLLAAQSALEAALLNQHKGDTMHVMHSRRWNWFQSQMTSTWPFIGQPGLGQQQGGLNYATAYGAGFRGILPNGAPVVVDNNIATNKGTGTDEDEIFVVPQSECHLWEDPNAPLFIRAEQPNAKSLGLDLVVYSFFGFTFGRYPSAIQKVGGTGLVTPTF